MASRKIVLAMHSIRALRNEESHQATMIRLRFPKNKKGGGAPKGAFIHGRATGAAAGFAEPARLPALHRGACRSERTPRLSPGRASRKREDAGVTRAVIRA